MRAKLINIPHYTDSLSLSLSLHTKANNVHINLPTFIPYISGKDIDAKKLSLFDFFF